MNLYLKRDKISKSSTIGQLFIEDKFECYTLEDIVRPNGEKVYGETAIPAGSYSVVIDLSNRFGRLMPHILNVPGFDGVRIHAGNTAADTEGCLLVGDTRSEDSIGQSKVAFERLFRNLQGATAPITLTIKDGY